MADEERIFQLLAKIAVTQSELQRDIDGIGARITMMEIYQRPLTNGYETMRADVTRLQLDMEKVRDTQYNMVEHFNIPHRGACGRLENDVQ